MKDQIQLGQWREEDFLLFYTLFSDKQVMQYAWIDCFQNEKEAQAYYQNMLAENQKQENRMHYDFPVYQSESGDFIGYGIIDIITQNEFGGCGELGYFLLPQYWGKGYALQIAELLCEASFSKIKLHKVFGACNINNKASEHVMKKLGMVKEGELRAARFKDGRWDSELRYSILLEEWQERQKK